MDPRDRRINMWKRLKRIRKDVGGLEQINLKNVKQKNQVVRTKYDMVIIKINRFKHFK